jgi:hypothetical protein
MPRTSKLYGSDPYNTFFQIFFQSHIAFPKLLDDNTPIKTTGVHRMILLCTFLLFWMMVDVPLSIALGRFQAACEVRSHA